jgi:D-sedoheptulose 7-phosphate isomerase
MKNLIKKHLDEHKTILSQLKFIELSILTTADLLINALHDNKTLFWCGNGGSESDSHHISGELIGRFMENRKPLKSIALSSGGAEGSCISNDFGYDQIYARQIEGLGTPGDVLIGITTSGNSQNVLNALEVANQKNLKTIGFLGKGGGKAASIAHHSIIIPSDSTARIQEMHILIGHIMCDLIEEGLNLKA